MQQRQLRAKWLLHSTIFGVCGFIKTESATAVQREFRLRFNIQPPTTQSICRWNCQFLILKYRLITKLSPSFWITLYFCICCIYHVCDSKPVLWFFSSQEGTRDLSLFRNVQNDCGPHCICCSVGTGFCFLWVNWPGCESDRSSSSSTRLKINRTICLCGADRNIFIICSWVCYNEQFLSIKSGCHNEHRCYNERGRILFIMESSIIIFTRERLFMLFMCVTLFMLLKCTRTVYKNK